MFLGFEVLAQLVVLEVAVTPRPAKGYAKVEHALLQEIRDEAGWANVVKSRRCSKLMTTAEKIYFVT